MDDEQIRQAFERLTGDASARPGVALPALGGNPVRRWPKYVATLAAVMAAIVGLGAIASRHDQGIVTSDTAPPTKQASTTATPGSTSLVPAPTQPAATDTSSTVRPSTTDASVARPSSDGAVPDDLVVTNAAGEVLVSPRDAKRLNAEQQLAAATPSRIASSGSIVLVEVGDGTDGCDRSVARLTETSEEILVAGAHTPALSPSSNSFAAILDPCNTTSSEVVVGPVDPDSLATSFVFNINDGNDGLGFRARDIAWSDDSRLLVVAEVVDGDFQADDVFVLATLILEFEVDRDQSAVTFTRQAVDQGGVSWFAIADRPGPHGPIVAGRAPDGSVRIEQVLFDRTPPLRVGVTTLDIVQVVYDPESAETLLIAYDGEDLALFSLSGHQLLSNVTGAAL